jgi:two-component system, cell cycle sensor histidine kinase and response regulator CckA
MSQVNGTLRNAQARLAAAFDACLRQAAFENRYFLHPRRLSALGEELAAQFAGFFDDPPSADPLACGRRLVREGIGERPVLLLVATFQDFLRGIPLGEPAGASVSPARGDATAVAVLQGYMKEREAQLYDDQEQMRRALSTALETQSRELLVKNHALDTSTNGILIADREGKVTWVNASFLSLWGFASAADCIGSPLSRLWAEEDRRTLRELPPAEGWRGELDTHRRDGTPFSVEVSTSLIRNEAGEVIGVMTSFSDITERKRLQSQVLQAQKMDALGQLAGGIAHDFNNLLTAISGYLQLLMQDARGNAEMSHDLMEIKAATERGIGLTRQLRFFTRQASGTQQILSLNDVIRETWAILKRTFPPEITIDLQLSPSLWNVEADPNQMSQVLVNLCVNARDAMSEPGAGRPAGTLTIETANVEIADPLTGRYMTVRPGAHVHVRIRDTGIGMTAEQLERLFVPFVTSKSARSGTGLGLAVVYGIVSSHHGAIDVHSEPGSGAAFDLYFPRAERQKKARDRLTAAPHFASGHGRILVVDDEPQVRDVLTRTLVACGYEVTTAGDGKEALARFGDGNGIDLVILDLMMPVMGGRECLSRLREVSPSVRVVATTGYTSDGSAHDLLRQGAAALLEKPLDLPIVAETVKRVLSSRAGGRRG